MAPGGLTIAIDLGTENTCVAVFHEGQVKIIPDDGNRLMPSYVSFTKNKPLVGSAAKKRAVRDPQNTIYHALRFLGRKYKDKRLQRDLEYLPFRTYDAWSWPKFIVTSGGGSVALTPTLVLAMIMAKAKANVEDTLKVRVDQAVIVIPSGFTLPQRLLVRDIALIAGLEPLFLLSGTSAAAIAYTYYFPPAVKRTLLFMDIGAGESDAAVIEVKHGVVTVIATACCDHLGGADFDRRMVQSSLSALKEDSTWSAKGGVDKAAIYRLRTACERAKHNLTAQWRTESKFQSTQQDEMKTSSITRPDFERLNDDLFGLIVNLINNVLRATKKQKESIDDLIVVGGSARVPKIETLILGILNRKDISKRLHQDEAMASGAAIYAALISRGTLQTVPKLMTISYQDVTPGDLSCSLESGLIATVIQRHTRIPAWGSVSWSTTSDNQSKFRTSVFEGSSSSITENTWVGELELKLPPLPRGLQIEITFNVDNQGRLRVILTEMVHQDRSMLYIEDTWKRSTEETERLKAKVRIFRDYEHKARFKSNEKSLDPVHDKVTLQVRKPSPDFVKKELEPLNSAIDHQTEEGSSAGTQTAIGIVKSADASVASPWVRLRPKEFRLLHRSGTAEPKFALKSHKIEFPPRYCALSHVWGNQPKDQLLQCSSRDGVASVNITRTLYEAIEELTSDELPLWVDTICINQTDAGEKSQQVALMHRIYRRADRVAIWLGHQKGNSALGLDVLSWISMPANVKSNEERLASLPALKTRLEQPGNSLRLRQLQNVTAIASRSQRLTINQTEFQRLDLPHIDDPLWKSLGELLSPSWLFRLWTFQELMLGRDWFVAFGSTRLPWSAYFDVGIRLTLCGLLEHCIHHFPFEQKVRALTAFTRLDVYLGGTQKTVPFARYLDESRYRDVTEPVDRIYGVLSLANEGLRSKINIDYSETRKYCYWELFMEASKVVIQYSSSQAVLAGVNSKVKNRELPSWCPDYAVPCEVTPFGADGRAGTHYEKTILSYHDLKHVIGIGGAKMDKVAQPLPFKWAWPQRDTADIYGPKGLAAQTLRWLDRCWSFTSDTYGTDEAGAHRAYIMTVLGEIPPVRLTSGDAPNPAEAAEFDAWLEEKDDDVVGLRHRLEDFQMCSGPKEVEQSTEVRQAFQTLMAKLDGIWRNRVFFTTVKGRIGFASDRIYPGDHICLFFGESHMYILRDEQPGVFEFVSDAYVHGFMGGEWRGEMSDLVFKIC